MQVPVCIEIQPEGKEGHPLLHNVASSKNNTLYATTFDLSRGGAFITAPDIPVGTTCKLKLKFASGFELECVAEVVRSSKAHGIYPAGVGFSFKN